MKLAGKPYEVHLLAVIFLYVLGFAIYLNTFSVPFVFDDYPNIRDNPSIRLTSIDIGDIHAAAFESHTSRRPVANISFALNYLAGGYDVKGYHLVNILIHIVNGVLVYFLAFIILCRIRMPGIQPSMPDLHARLAALVAAAIFIAHPVQIQAVTYIVQRMTSMATMFYLLSLLFYLLGRLREDRTWRIVYWLAALASWLFALGSKEIAATLPVIIVIIEFLFFRDSDKTWPGIHPGLLILALAATVGVFFLYLGSEPAFTVAEQYAGRDITPGERMLTELRVLVFYLSLLAFPNPGRLSLEHAFTVSHSLTDPITTLAAAGILIALLFVGLRLARRHPTVSFCIMWFLITLSVESSFIGLELAFEHRLYLPMFSFALAIAYLLSLAPARQRTMATALAGVLVVILAATSITRNVTWQNPAALWADAASKNPGSFRAQNNLARALVDQGRPDQAALHFNEAIRLNPQYAEPHNNLGTLHARAGGFEQAQAHFGMAIELNPRYAEAYNNLGVALLSQGLAHDAALQLGQAIRLAPGYAKAHANLSAALASMGQSQEACRHLLIAMHLDPAVSHAQIDLKGCHSDSKSN
ncbi:MAG: tetratricopeptide repeat protein [Lysobacterales bacterium]|nr:MAG: tetratricopeptide repeat protein [Xanthomonadales bacterium]